MKHWNLQQPIKQIFTIFGIALLSFVFSLQCSDTPWQTGQALADSSVFQYVARVIASGGMPYLDTFDHKGPLLYLINLLGLQIDRLIGIWILELIFIFVTFALIYKIARLKCTRLTSVFVLLVTSSALFKYFEGGNLTEEYAMPMIAVSLYIFLDYFLNQRITNLRLIVSGMSFGAVCLLRINMISLWIVMCIGVLIDCICNRRFQALRKFLLYFLIGFGILVLPILLWLILNGAFNAFVSDYLLFNFSYSSSEITQQSASVAKQTSFLFFLNDSLVLFATCISAYLAVKKKAFLHILYLIYLLFTLLCICISGQQFLHYGMILVPALAFPFACIKDLDLDGKVVKAKTVPVLAAFYLLVIFALPNWLNGANTALVQTAPKEEKEISLTKAQEISKIVLANTTPQDKIIVCGNWNVVYNLSDRYAASRYSYQDPICTVDQEIKKSFFADLTAEKPQIVVVPHSFSQYEDIIKLLQTMNYQPIAQNNITDITVYKR